MIFLCGYGIFYLLIDIFHYIENVLTLYSELKELILKNLFLSVSVCLSTPVYQEGNLAIGS